MAAILAGCGPDFDPPSLIEKTRVLGARVEVAGAPERASPRPGETATVTWLVTAPGDLPSLGWAFALCVPGAAGTLGCAHEPLSTYQGIDTPPRLSIDIPAADLLGTGTSVILYGRICASSAPEFDPRSGYPACTSGGEGTTASVTIRLQGGGEDGNHNPTADRALQFDGQPWPASLPGGDPCATGPRVSAASENHRIALTTLGTDRESYSSVRGDPPVPTLLRESLQLSQFTTAGNLKNPYSFVEADDPAVESTAEVNWNAPEAREVMAEAPVVFTFVIRDSRGGTDWTTRTACVVP
jgi:hypothetical protein